LVRLAEALAKMRLSAEATVADINEAMRLFTVSTLAASEANPTLMTGAGLTGGVGLADVSRAEEFLKRRLGLKMTSSSKQIIEEAIAQGYQVDAVRRGIIAMVSKNELQELNQGKLLKRIR
jgi:DNA replication licensing factor MCM5